MGERSLRMREGIGIDTRIPSSSFWKELSNRFSLLGASLHEAFQALPSLLVFFFQRMFKSRFACERYQDRYPNPPVNSEKSFPIASFLSASLYEAFQALPSLLVFVFQDMFGSYPLHFISPCSKICGVVLVPINTLLLFQPINKKYREKKYSQQTQHEALCKDGNGL